MTIDLIKLERIYPIGYLHSFAVIWGFVLLYYQCLWIGLPIFARFASLMKVKYKSEIYGWNGQLPKHKTWWCHQMETFSALLAICAGNSPVPSEFPAQRPVMQIFDVFFDLRLNKPLSKKSWGWWFEMLSSPLWCHRNEHNKAWTVCIVLVYSVCWIWLDIGRLTYFCTFCQIFGQVHSLQ